ncbi:MAG: hypothetical protein K6T63_02210 [Alicyclobacillus herbarius]|uniref:hypothetical protein n=1 Tax=Alicyclobacillus herbarius TaxID=122960 RepID=UPI00047CC8C2|nr:hypothetical protein [Alicyclobacillus herbarius]MCL6631422.1 hypothetical protein [Alicyclobacillus herbarius]
MELTWWTPHQYQPLQSYVDTALLGMWNPYPLDIAVPYGAAHIIAKQIMRRLSEYYQGRIAGFEFGAFIPEQDPLTQPVIHSKFAHTLSRMLGNPVQFIIVLADRQLERDFQHGRCDTVRWLFCDWWHWLSERTPVSRRQDVWMYLCLTSQEYRERPEFLEMGLQPAVVTEMTAEGERLLRLWLEAAYAQIEAMWSFANTDAVE